MNIPYYLEMYSRKSPEKIALKTEDSQYTYVELNEQADRLAAGLEKAGVEQGDKIILVLPNGYDFVVSYFAVLKIGAIVVPINDNLTHSEIERIYQNAEAKGIIAKQESVAVLTEADISGIKVTNGDVNNWLNLHDLLLEPSSKVYESTMTETDISTILYTSGTTGHPKGVVFQNRSILAVAQMICIEMEMSEHSVSLLMMPLSHSAPLHLFFVSAMMVGATAVTRKAFHPVELLKAVEAEKATHFFGAPIAYLYAAKVLEEHSFDLSSMEWWVYGGAAMGANEIKYVQKQFATDRLTCVYGLTEGGPSGSLLFAEEHDEKVGSVGRRASLFTELRIVNDVGEDVEAEEIGEVVLKGLGMMKEYYNNPDETEKAYIDGWLRTGDLAKFDKDGYIWIVDRVKDIIISGGINIYPFEIEQRLLEFEGIQDVAVVGVPHREWGETVKAFYVGEKEVDEEAVSAFVGETLAPFKVPRLYEKIDEIPRSATGKILKHQLR